MRGATRLTEFKVVKRRISIHAPHAGCDLIDPIKWSIICDFNPRTPCGVRRAQNCNSLYSHNFNPRTPCGVRRTHCRTVRTVMPFQSTHPMRGATFVYNALGTIDYISIHAPHAGCDCFYISCRYHIAISIHAPHAGCDNIRGVFFRTPEAFQSTHPMRGATLYLVSNRGSHRRHRADSLKNKLISSKQTNKRSKTATFPRGSPAISSSPEVRGAPLSAQNSSTPSLSYFCSTPNCSIRFLQLFPR